MGIVNGIDLLYGSQLNCLARMPETRAVCEEATANGSFALIFGVGGGLECAYSNDVQGDLCRGKEYSKHSKRRTLLVEMTT